jgi:hypothetical protein
MLSRLMLALKGDSFGNSSKSPAGRAAFPGSLFLSDDVLTVGGQGFLSATRPYLAVIWENRAPGEDTHLHAPKTSVSVSSSDKIGHLHIALTLRSAHVRLCRRLRSGACVV